MKTIALAAAATLLFTASADLHVAPVADVADRAPVAAVSPAPNSAVAAPDASVTMTLEQPLATDGFDPSIVDVFGRWSGVAPGTARLEDGGRTIVFDREEPFQAGEWVTVSLRSGAPLASGGRMETGYTWSFWIRPSTGSFDLRDLGARSVLEEGEEHAQPYGAYAGDFNYDGYPDLAIPNEVSADVRIMLNDGKGNYEEFAVLDIPDGNWPSPNEGADFNRDGLTDFVVGNAGNDLLSLFLGDGQGWFRVGGNVAAGDNVRGVCPLDLNHDGWPDVATVNMAQGERSVRGGVAILLNSADGSGRLTRTEQVESPGRGEKTCAVGDANGDGHMDLFVGAYFSDEVIAFLSDGKGNLEPGARVAAGGQPWMLVAADLNGDGHVDVVSANSERDNIGVLFGDGQGGLSEAVTYETGERPLAVDIGDLDGDGDLEIVSSDFDGNSFTVFENLGDGTFRRAATLSATTNGSCAILHDRDRDGDLDITGVDETADTILLFENPGG